MSQYQNRQSFTPASGDAANHIVGSATARAGLCEFNISSSATPVEQSGKYLIARTTTAGTTPAGNTTITKRDTFSPAAGCTVGGGGYTTEPTQGDVLWDISVHQKATFRWVAYPGREFLTSPAANAGIALFVTSQSAAFATESDVAWLE